MSWLVIAAILVGMFAVISANLFANELERYVTGIGSYRRLAIWKKLVILGAVFCVTFVITFFLGNNATSDAPASQTGETAVPIPTVTANYPKITLSVKDNADAIRLGSPSDIESANLTLALFNSGTVPIDQLIVELYAIEGLSYDKSVPNNDLGLTQQTNVRLDLNSQLLPGGYAWVDLKANVLKFLRELTLVNPEHTYVVVINAVFLPRRVGDSLPVQTPGNTKYDRDNLFLEFSPAVLQSGAVDKYLKPNPYAVSIVNYPASNTSQSSNTPP